ncbi:hypothetical protein AAFX34_15795 [Vibrio vulnificus]|uniref:hypothetical protein n=1 Tax=Vibrio vulnificus TaxID=672 RepID=UPI0028BCEF67|nr:hypothetical protein [Vibrio vulnificus]HDY7676919.1 hypothetical protein [Vibrio vulnificus]
MKSSWFSLNKFLFEKETDKKEEKFKTYLSPYFVPKACRIGSDEQDKTVIEFKYVDVNESTKKVAHHETHRIYFEVGEKTERVYKIYFYALPVANHNDVFISMSDLDKAFEKLSSKLNDPSKDKYVATLAATKQCLSMVNQA